MGYLALMLPCRSGDALVLQIPIRHMFMPNLCVSAPRLCARLCVPRIMGGWTLDEAGTRAGERGAPGSMRLRRGA
jgi:hypothetical protein